ncbi:phage tail protein [Mycolicibacterium iranicum]|uniref:Phage tail protein n=1 Tax=Mycolicibacterium iranicum TaxID=912594 RepID=A0A178LSE0_MYCIR|nr:phage tail protein [Mycolicibacterium iranicum]OAN36774.1 phage tail protein [Mycolicibacterium iranicum]
MPTGFVKNAHRIDPYRTYNFCVADANGKLVLGVSKVGPLRRVTNVITHRSGGSNGTDIRTPGRTQYDAVTMERGVTHDLDFAAWANRVHPYAGDSAMDLVGYRQDLTLMLKNEKGQVAQRYFLHGCWVSEFTAVPQLDGAANAIAVETIKIEMEGWERDPDTQEPSEASDPVVPPI